MAVAIRAGRVQLYLNHPGTAYYADIMTHESTTMRLVRQAIEVNPVQFVPKRADIFTGISNGKGWCFVHQISENDKNTT